jgi:hypothetical protein
VSIKRDKEKYSAAIAILYDEGQFYWQTFGAYLVAHTVFLGFLLQSLAHYQDAHLILLFYASIYGLILTIPWLASLCRNSGYFRLRIEQARMAEPLGWNLIDKDGKAFAEGEKVKIGTECLQMPWIARKLKNRMSATFLIICFAIAYVLISVISNPWYKILKL